MFFFWLKFESKVCERIFWFVRYSDSPLSLWFSFCYYLRLWISLKLNWFQVNETIADSFGNSFTSFIQSLSLLFHLDLDSFFRFLCCCCYKITSLVGIFFLVRAKFYHVFSLSIIIIICEAFHTLLSLFFRFCFLFLDSGLYAICQGLSHLIHNLTQV